MRSWPLEALHGDFDWMTTCAVRPWQTGILALTHRADVQVRRVLEPDGNAELMSWETRDGRESKAGKILRSFGTGSYDHVL